MLAAVLQFQATLVHSPAPLAVAQVTQAAGAVAPDQAVPLRGHAAWTRPREGADQQLHPIPAVATDQGVPQGGHAAWTGPREGADQQLRPMQGAPLSQPCPQATQPLSFSRVFDMHRVMTGGQGN